MTTIAIVTHVTILGNGAVTGTDSADDEWYCKDVVAYVLLVMIGVAMVIIITLVVCFCCRSHYHGKQM